MKKWILGALYALFLTTCTTNVPDDQATVIRIEPTHATYFNEEGDSWHVKHALIYSGKPHELMYPVQYDSVIHAGSVIKWHCHQITWYKVGGEFNAINWPATKNPLHSSK